MILDRFEAEALPAHELQTQPEAVNPKKTNQGERSLVDVCFAVIALALFGIWIYHFRHQNTLGEDDLYSVLDGLLDGARTGSGFASPLHYGKSFGFGYIAAMYRFADPNVLQDPLRLIALINSIGFFAALIGSACFWLSTRLLYGVRIATIALTLFALSPMMLDIGTSGHQILVAFAFLSAAQVLLFLPLSGIPWILSSALGSLLLLGGLTMRAEIFLAIPFLALARADFSSVRSFIKSSLLRALGPLAALMGFFLLKHFCVALEPSETAYTGSFFDRYYSLSNLPRGVLVYFVGCGFATTIVGLVAVWQIIRTAATGTHKSEPATALLHSAVGPLALIIPALLFWICNPLPVRHFILCLAGTAILIGCLVTRLTCRLHWTKAYALVIGVVLFNQALAALSGPIILSHSPSRWVQAPNRPRNMPRAPLGTPWSYHRAVQAERLRTDAFAEMVRGACDAKTIVISDRQRQVFFHLYESPTRWSASASHFRSFATISAQNGPRTLVVMSGMDAGPLDSVAEILSDPQLNGYQLVRDPGTVSIYDKTPIPPNRAARLGCFPETSNPRN